MNFNDNDFSNNDLSDFAFDYSENLMAGNKVRSEVPAGIGFKTTTDLISLAIICGQTPMGEMMNGSLMFAYGKDGGEALPGQKPVGFTQINIACNYEKDETVNALVQKILTSGQIYSRDGKLNQNLASAIDQDAGKKNCLQVLTYLNACDPHISIGQVDGVNLMLLNALAQSPIWVNGFKERIEILQNISKDSPNAYIFGATQQLKEHLDTATEICNQSTMERISEHYQAR